MTSSFLRTFRIVFSAIVLICFLLVFTDFRYMMPENYINLLVWLQFIPSAIKFTHIGTLAAGGFIVVLLLTLLTGRSYCSFLCPLGIGQDLFSRIGGRIRKKFRRYGYKKPHTVIRYSLLAITLGVTLVWGIFLLTLLDPYSIFGRFTTYFAKPVVMLLNNFAAGVLARLDNYSLHHVKIEGWQLVSYAIPAAFFILVGTLSLTKGRLYCNMVCPVGTLLGLFSKIAIFRVRFEENKCTRCGRCAIVCKSSCIDFLKQDIDNSRCVDCFNCIKTCPDKALSYGIVRMGSRKEHKTDEARRKVITGALLGLAGYGGFARAQDKTPAEHKATTVREEKNWPVAPPGAGSIEEFNKHCTACSLCITTCPNQVLVPSIRQYGLAWIMQPVMDFHKSFCMFNCTRCTEVCPTYALKPLELEAKKLTQLGKVYFIKDNCIVKTEKTACGACSEACPTKAVYMVPYEGNLLIPETNADICIGCGHCEYACPTVPYKAIYVDGNPIHVAAEKPVIREAEISAPEEFPF